MHAKSLCPPMIGLEAALLIEPLRYGHRLAFARGSSNMRVSRKLCQYGPCKNEDRYRYEYQRRRGHDDDRRHPGFSVCSAWALHAFMGLGPAGSADLHVAARTQRKCVSQEAS